MPLSPIRSSALSRRVGQSNSAATYSFRSGSLAFPYFGRMAGGRVLLPLCVSVRRVEREGLVWIADARPAHHPTSRKPR